MYSRDVPNNRRLTFRRRQLLTSQKMMKSCLYHKVTTTTWCNSQLLILAIVCGLLSCSVTISAFSPHPASRLQQQQQQQQQQQTAPLLVQQRSLLSPARTTSTSALLSSTSSSSSTDISTKEQQQQQLESAVQQLQKVLQREYASFFNPFERAYYQPDVTFCDPLSTLTGLDAYQTNVDMLAGRTWLGRVLFRDASIQLHSICGGDVVVVVKNDDTNTNKNNDNDNSDETFSITDITTRWTLRFCFKILPWQPVARFTGISVYQVKNNSNNNNKAGVVQIVRQDDYWDSINLKAGGGYEKVNVRTAVQDFVQQLLLLPSAAAAAAAAPQQAGPELPYQLLRRAVDYEVRQYPAFTAAMLPSYKRRDEGYAVLGSFCKGLVPMAPAILQIQPDNSQQEEEAKEEKKKTMLWPLTYAAPGEDTPPVPNVIQKEDDDDDDDERVQVVTIPSQIVAVGRFTDASVEPVVRKAHRALQAACERDGLELELDRRVNDNDDDDDDDDDRDANNTALQFCQYDAIFSMGQRRGEVWIPLKEGKNPWSNNKL